MKVAPSGLPRWRSLRRLWLWATAVASVLEDEGEVSWRRDELRRNSWVIAMPMEAKEREVRSQARKVRSTQQSTSQYTDLANPYLGRSFIDGRERG